MTNQIEETNFNASLLDLLMHDETTKMLYKNTNTLSSKAYTKYILTKKISNIFHILPPTIENLIFDYAEREPITFSFKLNHHLDQINNISLCLEVENMKFLKRLHNKHLTFHNFIKKISVKDFYNNEYLTTIDAFYLDFYYQCYVPEATKNSYKQMIDGKNDTFFLPLPHNFFKDLPFTRPYTSIEIEIQLTNIFCENVLKLTCHCDGVIFKNSDSSIIRNRKLLNRIDICQSSSISSFDIDIKKDELIEPLNITGHVKNLVFLVREKNDISSTYLETIDNISINYILSEDTMTRFSLSGNYLLLIEPYYHCATMPRDHGYYSYHFSVDKDDQPNGTALFTSSGVTQQLSVKFKKELFDKNKKYELIVLSVLYLAFETDHGLLRRL